MTNPSSKAQIRRDENAILSVLIDGKAKSFSQISLQAGENLWTALRSLVAKSEVEVNDGQYKRKAG